MSKQTVTDTYGRTVSYDPATNPVTYTVTSTQQGVEFTVSFSASVSLAQVMMSINAHAPAWYVPPAPPAPTEIDSLDFIARFAQSEQQAIFTARQSNWQLDAWITQLASAGTVSVVDPRVIAGFATLVSAGLLTQARSTQILDLGVASP